MNWKNTEIDFLLLLSQILLHHQIKSSAFHHSCIHYHSIHQFGVNNRQNKSPLVAYNQDMDNKK